MKLDLLIVNHHSAAELLASLDHLGPWPHGRVAVVDNSQDAGQAQMLAQGLARRSGALDWSLDIAEANLGFAAGCNRAWRATQAPHVLLLNPDARITGAALSDLWKTLRQHPEAAAASPRTDWDEAGGFVLPRPEPQGPWAWACRSLQAAWGAATWASAAVRRTRREMSARQPFVVPCLAGAVLLLERAAVEQAGGLFDERYFMFFEDADLSLRLRRQGRRLLLDPSVRAVHAWRHAAHKGPLMEQSRAAFLERHHGWWEGWDVRLRRWEAGRPEASWGIGNGRTVLRLDDPGQAARELGAIEAFSPSLRGQPALVRLGSPRPFNPAEWAQLERGFYWALAEGVWRAFEVSAPGR